MGKVSLMFNEYECMGCHACEVACKQEHGLSVGPRVVRVIERAPFLSPYSVTIVKMPPVPWLVQKMPSPRIQRQRSFSLTGINVMAVMRW
jgi:Fe-S-cluster-containing hydrogenase component 2